MTEDYKLEAGSRKADRLRPLARVLADWESMTAKLKTDSE